MKKAYYITQHTKPLPMHTVKAKIVHSTADTKRFSFQSKKSHTFYIKKPQQKIPSISYRENLTHRQTKTVYYHK